jgi:RNA polymerase sigma-70 factor, ECF subfamily
MVDRSERGEVNAAPDASSLNDLFSVTYEELRRLAYSVKRRDRSLTLSPTALVNEAWLKLVATPQFATTSRLHFKRVAARAMRQVLVEAARRRNASKRGGGELNFVTLGDAAEPVSSSGDDLLALDSALVELERIEPRQATLVESRFFGGLDISETAALLQVSEVTVLRDWRAARAWLAHRLRPAP